MIHFSILERGGVGKEVLRVSFRYDVNAKLEPKALPFSKDLLMQYKILQTHFVESLCLYCWIIYKFMCAVLSFATDCRLLGHYKYPDYNPSDVVSVVFTLWSSYSKHSQTDVVFNLNLIFRRCDRKRQCIYSTIRCMYYVKAFSSLDETWSWYFLNWYSTIFRDRKITLLLMHLVKIIYVHFTGQVSNDLDWLILQWGTCWISNKFLRVPPLLIGLFEAVMNLKVKPTKHIWFNNLRAVNVMQ